MTVVELCDVDKGFRRTPLLEGVNLAVEEGTATAIVGPNGSGKSVLLKLMCRFLDPDRGEVVIDPRYMSASAAYPQEFGVLINGPGYLPHRTGWENLVSLAAIRKQATDDDIRNAMEAVGLSPDLRQRAGLYSMGMKQKLGLAQAIMEGQPMLVLDEPFNALDDDSVEQVMAVLRRHVDAGGTLVFTSHDKDHVEQLATDVHRINAGRVDRVR